ncbi:DUF3617 family protein [Bradyrhizobium sp. AUGA SZCCT0169]|uniref:DUF3617 domain-containing protein n=1 Tax=Bradyrhizobium sp. AUGA SZCCT0169 TaxID=2807663 RepID=UPI001BA930ED|nr:DUF3617 family protein [Bradyrhizobium sp. AUGA SZCCT0169]MBR1250997.1 DUF3617 family protein [Bradyrhizobium sp. AUGA SZCCT0169]
MARQLDSVCLAFGLLAVWPASHASAVELPVRKAGLGEMKVVQTGSPVPEMTMQQCTDATTDKDMSTSFSPMTKDACSKNDIQKTATGYVTDSVCGFGGMSVKSRAEITGDFNSAYTVKSTSNSTGAPAGVPRDSTATIEAKWLGACKADQKPGDIIMPGGMKINLKDMEKLKGLLPKQAPK